MLLSLIFALGAPASDATVFGTVQKVAGEASVNSRGKTSPLAPNRVLRYGDCVRVVRGGLVVSVGKVSRTFWPSREWQPVLRIVSSKAKSAYDQVPKLFDPAVMRRGRFNYPGVAPVPCALFIVVTKSPTSHYQITLNGETLADGPPLDRPGVMRKLRHARDAEGATEVKVTVDNETVTVHLMTREKEAALLKELAAADREKTPSVRRLLRAKAFAACGQFAFARYEIDGLPVEDARRLLTAQARRFAPIRPPL